VSIAHLFRFNTSVCHVVVVTVTTCLENLEMLGNLTAVRDFTKSHVNVREKILSEKCGLNLFIVSCIFASIQVFMTRYE